MDIVKYRVREGEFDGIEGGTIVEVTLVFYDPCRETGLVLHSPDVNDRHSMGCLEFAKKDSKGIFYPTSSKTFINVECDEVETLLTTLKIIS